MQCRFAKFDNLIVELVRHRRLSRMVKHGDDDHSLPPRDPQHVPDRRTGTAARLLARLSRQEGGDYKVADRTRSMERWTAERIVTLLAAQASPVVRVIDAIRGR